MKRAVLLLAIVSVVISCEKEFDISKQVDTATVWISFVPSNDYDTTYFHVQATSPLAGVVSPVKTGGEEVEVRINGDALSLEKYKWSLPERRQIYCTDYVFNPGEKVEVLASVPSVGTVSASCEIPHPFPDYVFSSLLLPKSGTLYKLILDLDYSIMSSERGYFGVSVLQQRDMENQTGRVDPDTGEMAWDEIIHSSSIAALSPVAIQERGALSFDEEAPVIVTPRYYNTSTYRPYYSEDREAEWRRPVQIWLDASEKSDYRKTVAFNLTELKEYTEYDILDGKEWVRYSYKYKLILYSFSESFYNYLKAQYNRESSDFSSLGLAPPSFVYTNVDGGSGICGAYIVSESEWFEITR